MEALMAEPSAHGASRRQHRAWQITKGVADHARVRPGEVDAGGLSEPHQPAGAYLHELWIFGGTTEIMKEIIGRGL